MCGINGILRLDPTTEPVDREELLRTRDAMALRGPDGCGAWFSEDGGVALGHRRLAIIDLSEAGAQPMSSGDGRFRITFNGEIYNYAEIRRELITRGVEFRSNCDTEVILALYARDGAEALGRLRGMYALAIWDEAERSLLLARDPYGIKPLYYTTGSDHLRFASQVKALEAGGAIDDAPDPAGLCGFLLWGSVPEPHTLRRGVRALPAGSYLRVVDGRVEGPVRHYEFSELPVARDSDPVAALEDSIRAHLVSDVPVAVFLSAGMDSTLIAALARRQAVGGLTTLTLRFPAFDGTPMDEAPLAAEVARAIGTNHVERTVRREDFLDLWPAALEAMDQPSIDGFNTYVVSREAHAAGFKVVLSGLGGDELFGSYDAFRDVPRWCRWASRLKRLPGLGRLWPGLTPLLSGARPKLAGFLAHGATLPGAYFLRRGLFLPTELPGLIGEERTREGLAAYDPLQDAGKYLPYQGSARSGEEFDEESFRAVHLMESSQYMRNQLLRDSDWASMAHSLELRVPLVDDRLRHRIAGAGFEPARSQGKAALVRRAAPELPDALWSRPKSGFSIPVMEWLDDQVGIDTARGTTSRMLAVRVLRHFGIATGEGKG